MGTVISLYHRHRFLIVIIIEQGILCLFETKIRSMMKTKIFIFLVVAAFIGCIFAEDVDLKRRDEVDKIESPEEVKLSGLGVGMNAMRIQGLDRGDCVPRGSVCHPRYAKPCCSGSSCRRWNRIAVCVANM